MDNHTYIAIDLKSFYASVECVERGLDPLTTNLVVADASRTEKTICLAVSPSLKTYKIPGRARLFEVVSKVNEVNAIRMSKIPGHKFTGSSYSSVELLNPNLELSYITAVPRMALYMEYSTRIYDIYLKYVAPEDMHVYSVDEVFIDVTGYLKIYGMSAYELAKTMISDVFKTTGITATAGIGTNMYLCKIAMDIVAKHIPADEDGVRIASLDEMEYRRLLWNHRPITDFWRVGPGYAKKLYEYGIYTMGDVARCSIGTESEFYNEELLYNAFGVNAELLIDHAWGYEPCTIKDIKDYKPQERSLGMGQVLTCPYTADKARVVVIEMADQLALDLFDKGVVTDQLVLTLGYDIDNISSRTDYSGDVVTDRYGRKIPKHAHSSVNLDSYTSSSHTIMKAAGELFDRIVDSGLHIRRLNISASHVIREKDAVQREKSYRQLDLFNDYGCDNEDDKKEKKIQEAELSIKHRYGKNAILKGINFKEGATARERNGQIGGHKA